jgi:hypothetical protein
MGDKNLTKTIVVLIKDFSEDEPIFIKDLLKHLNVNSQRVKPVVNTILHRQVGDTLQSFDRGVFYKPKQSISGQYR